MRTHFDMHMSTFFIGAMLLYLCVFPISSVQGAETYNISPVISPITTPFYTNENWALVPHPRIAWFTVYEDGSSDGMTEHGIPFRQYTIPNSAGIRVQRFEIQDHYHYIVEGRIVYTLADVSAELARAYERANEA